MTKKSVLKNFLKIFRSSKSKGFGKSISVNEAIDIQNAYIASACQDDGLIEAPYVEIAKQLISPKKEVFEAALYYLQKIALNSANKKDEIVDLLENIVQNDKIKEDCKQLILQTIDKIKGI